MAVLEGIVLALALLVPVILVRRHRAPTQTAFEWGLLLRKVVVGGVTLLLALTLLASGIGWMILAGGILLAIIWTYLLLFTSLDVRTPREVWRQWTR